MAESDIDSFSEPGWTPRCEQGSSSLRARLDPAALEVLAPNVEKGA
jgi:hypothetical protein